VLLPFSTSLEPRRAIGGQHGTGNHDPGGFSRASTPPADRHRSHRPGTEPVAADRRDRPSGIGKGTAKDQPQVDPAAGPLGRELSRRAAIGRFAGAGAVATLAFTEPSGPPAWKTLPSRAVVATEDKTAGTDLVRSMAERAGAAIVEVTGAHAIMVAQPKAVTDVILTALAAVSRARDETQNGPAMDHPCTDPPAAPLKRDRVRAAVGQATTGRGPTARSSSSAVRLADL
jgi:pimeloyl-ACP methyl ester carboxylesterase